MFDQDGIAEEEISQEEIQLAEQLKKLCNKKGQEQESKLSESATVLMRLGELYTQKAVNAQNPMIQKLSFLKSCALLNAARVRFEKKDMKAKQEEVSSLLEKFSESLYDVCAITGYQNSLQGISTSLFERISELREEVKTKLESIQNIRKSENAALSVEKEIITQVSQLYLETTENFKSLMADISKECILLLGNPPCKFCQVGLGSMAREEITLYSDYEHVIVLEDAIETMTKNEQERMKEYFRWFAVFFQAIIIGFGETFVRSVGVKSINDLYSDDPEKNWYFDVFTPCGIAFDGMVPHSCMNPLGRQNQTKNRRHKVEFIQSATKMARYLSSEEHLKNGYYIKDILTRTCLAFGDEKVYESFEKASTEILQSERMLAVANDLSSKMSGNVNGYIGGERILLNQELFDPKRTFYRPITAQLAYLATFFRVESSSSLEIIDGLEQMKALNNPELAHKLRYAVAIICKIRMDAYVKTGHQRSEGEQQKVLKAVGDHDTSVIYKCLRYLVVGPALIAQAIGERPRTVGDCVELLQNFNEEFMADETDDIDEMIDSFKFDEAMVEIEKQLGLGPSKRHTKLRTLLLQCHFRLGEEQEDPEKRLFHFNEAKALARLLLDHPEITPGPKLDVFYILAILEDDREKALEACQKFRRVYRMTKHELAELKDEEIATGIAYSCEATMRQKKETYLVLFGMELELSKNLYTPRKLYPLIFSLVINEDLYGARFVMCYVMANLTLNSPFSDFTKISYLVFLNEFESHSKELQMYAESVTENIYAEQKKRSWPKRFDPNDDKASSVSLAQSALLHDELQVSEKIGKCLDICRKHLHDEDFVFIYAYALAAFAFRTWELKDNVKEVKQMRSQAPKSVKNLFLFQITMKRYDEIQADLKSEKPSKHGFVNVLLKE